MFIFIYNTLVLDVKRIDFEARMIDTLRSWFFFFFLITVYLSSIAVSPYFPVSTWYIFAMLLPMTDNCSARYTERCIYSLHCANAPNIFIYPFKLEDTSRSTGLHLADTRLYLWTLPVTLPRISNNHKPVEAARVSKIWQSKVVWEMPWKTDFH